MGRGWVCRVAPPGLRIASYTDMMPGCSVDSVVNLGRGKTCTGIMTEEVEHVLMGLN